MFKVQCLVEDKRLAEVLRLLDGKCYDLKAPVPVKGAVVSNGQVKPAFPEGKLQDLLFERLKQARLKQFTIKRAKEIVKSVGRAENSAYASLEALVKTKAIKRIGDGTYEVRS